MEVDYILNMLMLSFTMEPTSTIMRLLVKVQVSASQPKPTIRKMAEPSGTILPKTTEAVFISLAVEM